MKIANNQSTAGSSASVVAGIYCDRNGGSADMEEINITNCTINRNRGTGSSGAQEAYGIYLSQVNFALIDNCLVRANSTKATTTTPVHSAGLKLIECDFCNVRNSHFINNRSGSFANASTADSTVLLNIASNINVGAGIINMGSGSGGTITALITSGQPPFTFNWSSNVSGNPQQIYVSGLTGGTYSLTITDSNECVQTRNVVITCNPIKTTYQVFTMCETDFTYTSGTKRGMLQMLNEGYNDLTAGHTNCILISSIFIAIRNQVPKI
jgi:hypothetical protein